MAGFSTWGDRSNKNRMPLTPPDFDYAYAKNLVDQSHFSQPSSRYRGLESFNKQYVHANSYLAQSGLSGRPKTHLPSQAAHDYNQLGPYMSQVAPNRSFMAEAAAPILPPLRPHDLAESFGHYAASNVHAPVEQKPKEEKATGGVAAHLDYDISTMADFVAEMSQGIVNPNTPVSAQYRTYVTQILSSTRLPSSTILLGLFYLASRMKILSARVDETRGSSSVYRMLTTCLLLGSKFLDDNTFQNRSWAEVSSIPVRELNAMELDWLFSFEWSIHGRMYDIHEGFFMWREHWLAFEESKLLKAKESQKLTPIDTNIRRIHSVQKPLMSPEGPIPAQYQRSRHYDTQWVSPLISEPSPPSAAYSGPATPEYYSNVAWVYGQPSAFPNQVWNSTTTTSGYASTRTQPSAYQQTASYLHPYATSKWNTAMPNCGCTIYTKCKEHYFMQTDPYGMQTVAC